MSETRAVRAPRRADAQRNHDLIVAAARAHVAQRGTNLVLEEVARSAGVGIGTLYRHFPTRQELLEALFLDEVLALGERAVELAEVPSALDALVTWLRLQMDLGSLGHSLGAAVMAAKHVEGSELQRAYVAMREAGGELLRRAQVAGAVRFDLDIVDLVKLVYGIVMVGELSTDSARCERMFGVVVAGIKTS